MATRDADAFSGRLMSGERVLWNGHPAPGLLFTSRDILLVPFSLAWCGFAVFWETTVVLMNLRLGQAASDGPGGPMLFFFPLFGGAFVCVGLFFVFGRFAVDAWLRGLTSYAVTDRRILIARAGPLANFTAISLDRIPDLVLRERQNGKGSIQFGQQVSMFMRRGFGSWLPSLDPTPQFLAIADVRRVFDLIQQQANRVA